ncbi:MAG: SAM-dependent chlorinase/fluorinase [Bacteroidia bacterium]|nr:SAM-dependent chlorinase/fluorinase [Bacteroidia bacterium]
MAVITLITDSGEADHYVAAIKARIMSVNPGLQVIDISHHIPACDIAHAAFVLRSVFRDFPKGTVHLVGVHAVGNRGDVPIALKLEEHYFVGPDNGLLGLVSEKPHQSLVDLNAVAPIVTTFPERDILAVAAAKLRKRRGNRRTWGSPWPTFKK